MTPETISLSPAQGGRDISPLEFLHFSSGSGMNQRLVGDGESEGGE
jgi:hypothetical protein